MTQYAIATDLNRCVGCLSCMVACKAVNNVPIGSYWNKVLRIGPSLKKVLRRRMTLRMYYLPVTVPALRRPRVREGVPHGASHKLEDGTVQIDKSKCIGCQFCAMACPYGVRYLNQEERVVEKCTLCEQRISQGELPSAWPSAAPAPASSATSIRRRQLRGAGTSRQPRLPVRGDDPDAREAEDYVEPYAENDIHHLADAGNEPKLMYLMREAESGGSRLCILNGPLFSSPSSCASQAARWARKAC